MDPLISVINELRKLNTIIDHQSIKLPQIVAVGAQSAGKSSVIEGIVGWSFLPRGNDVVTRCPLVLNLVNVPEDDPRRQQSGITGDWATLDHINNKIFTDFEEVENEIRIKVQPKTVSSVPIILTIYSHKVVDLSLVDLPGTIKVNLEDKDNTMKQDIKAMVEEYVKNPKSLILAVTPANNDANNSDALHIAKKYDPERNRTLCVLTKIDLMDKGTNAYNLLTGKKFSAKLGIIGVRCRSQEEVLNKTSVEDCLTQEAEFFRNNYRPIARKNGMPYLRQQLNKITTKMVVELIAKNKNEKYQFQGRCKLIIDSLSKLLLVEPFIEDFKMISAMFRWEFVAQKNILFVFAEYNFQDFALVFDNSEKCHKAIGFILKKGASVGNKELISQRFLPLFFKEISTNTESSSKFKEILFKWIEFQDEKEKKEYIQLLKNYNIYNSVFSRINNNLNPRKRKAKDCFYKNQNGESDAKRPNVYLKKIIELPNFEILKYVQNGNSRTKLSIFPTSERKYCYEYFWKKRNHCFLCRACQFRKKHVSAKIIKRSGKDVVMLNGTQHVCQMKDYKQIIEKPNFEVMSYEFLNICYNRIIIFLDPSRISCYEYARKFHCKTYYCRGCLSKNHFVKANICQKEDGTEFMLLKSNQHVCEPRKYNPEKYGKKEIIEAENFKIYKEFRNGKEKSKLVIFASSDKSTCYEYFWDYRKEKFSCLDCNKKKNRVTAELCVQDDGSNFVKLSKKKHTCEPREFKPEKFDISKKEIIESSKFRIFKYKNNGVETSKLIIFCETNKNLCYEYYLNKKDQFYQCSYCPVGKRPTATVCQNEDSKDYLILDNGEHVCNLREYNPEKYKDDVIVDKSMYKFISTTFGKTAQYLAIFSTQEIYYKFIFSNQRKHYYCSGCRHSNTFLTASFQNKGKENEVLYVSNQKHICEPFQYSLVENSTVKFPNFQLLNRKFRGKIHQYLIVFINEEKTECYEYKWNGYSKHFKCHLCLKHHKISIYAKIFKNDRNEECVELGKNKHKCQPKKFAPEDITFKLVKEPDFELYEVLYRGRNIKKLTIFDSKDRKYGYVYTFNDKKKKYVCSRCNTKCKCVTATIKQQENGQNYLELNEIKHVCELQKL